MKKSILIILVLIWSVCHLYGQYPGGNALDFDGENDYVMIIDAATLDVSNNLTISAWIYGHSYLENDLFVHKINAYGISVRDSSKFALHLSQNSSGTVWGEFLSDFIPTTGEWYHFAATYDAAAEEVRLYVNGELKNTFSYNESIASSGSHLYFGGYYGGQNLDGLIDEVRIWNITRTQAQIQSTLYDTLGSQYYTTNDSGLVGYWRFDEGVAGSNNAGVNFLPDLSTNGNHGTLQNFALTGDSSNWVSSGVPLTGIPAIQSNLPYTAHLTQNYPNPFNPTTAIGYRLSAVSNVQLSVYDILGREVATLINEKQQAGYHQVEWDASGFASGVYYYRIKTGEFRDVRKMVLIR